ncbi:MAG: alpha/beta hydrolase [Alphaproteobacteria bacterium]|nr:alpha/beta hydrolase [Alphaproteobacteria bacterium]
MTGTIPFLRNGSVGAPTILFAHGAGLGSDSPFMDAAAKGLAARGLRVLRFEFPYMAERRDAGRKRPPDRMPVLLDCFRAAIGQAGARSFVLAGKSMGGRAASLIADETGAAALVAFGFPFHPPGKPRDPARVRHLARLKTPMLIVQGERDSFGGRAEVAAMALSPAIRIHWVPDGNHDLNPRKSSGFDADALLAQALDAAALFIRGRS